MRTSLWSKEGRDDYPHPRVGPNAIDGDEEKAVRVSAVWHLLFARPLVRRWLLMAAGMRSSPR